VIRVILIAVLMILVARAFWRVVDGILEAATGAAPAGRSSQRPMSVKLARDPVCGTHVPVNGSPSLTIHGTTHYFCSIACRDQFVKSA
jgi:YHS domain-containing protein